MYIYLIKWCEHWIVQNESFQVNPPYIRRSQCIFENHNLSTLLLKVEPYSWWWYHNHWGLTQNGFSQPKFKTKHTKCINFLDNSIHSNLPQKRVQLHVRSFKSTKWPRSISQSQMIQKFIFRISLATKILCIPIFDILKTEKMVVDQKNQ